MLYGVNHWAVCCLDSVKIRYKGIKNAVLYLSMINENIAFYNTDGLKLFYRIIIR